MSSKPFLKWAGGKRWLAYSPYFPLPKVSGRYYEPFLGGAASYLFHRFDYAVLTDVNEDLINCYQAVRDEWRAVFYELERHSRNHSKEYYYSIRRSVTGDRFRRAADFIYLNRTCWNGLYRVNLMGEFNVPIGKTGSILFDQREFFEASKALQGASIYTSDFESVVNSSTEGDLVFIDPPYTTAHNMNGFVKYNEKIFTWNDQVRLSLVVKSAISRGVSVFLTNADHCSIREIYEGVGQHVTVNRSTVISGKNSGRKMTTELIIHNFS